MSKQQGYNTIAIAKELIKQLAMDSNRYKDIEIYYDHGSPLGQPAVCAPMVNIGRQYGNDATLGAADIVVVRGSKVLIAVEIEEHEVRPKTIIGDIFSLLLADRIKIKKEQYSKEDLVVLVVLPGKAKGKSTRKYLRLERHLKKFITTFNITNIRKIRILPISQVDMVRRTERLIRLEIGKCL